MKLKCCLCMYSGGYEVKEAITIIEGRALCEDHLAHANSPWHIALVAAKRDETAKAEL